MFSDSVKDPQFCCPSEYEKSRKVKKKLAIAFYKQDISLVVSGRCKTVVGTMNQVHKTEENWLSFSPTRMILYQGSYLGMTLSFGFYACSNESVH